MKVFRMSIGDTLIEDKTSVELLQTILDTLQSLKKLMPNMMLKFIFWNCPRLLIFAKPCQERKQVLGEYVVNRVSKKCRVPNLPRLSRC